MSRGRRSSVRSQAIAKWCKGTVEIVLNHAGLTERIAPFDIDGENAVEMARKIEDEAAAETAARDAGGGAASGDGDLMPGGNLKGGDNLMAIERLENGERFHFIDRSVDAVGPARNGVAADLSFDRQPQILQKGSVAHL